MGRFLLVMVSLLLAAVSCTKDSNNDSNKASGDLVATFNRAFDTLESTTDSFPFWECDSISISCSYTGIDCNFMQARVFVTIVGNGNSSDTFYVAKNTPVSFPGLPVGDYYLVAYTYAPYVINNGDSSLFEIAFTCETQLDSFQIIEGQTTSIIIDTIWND